MVDLRSDTVTQPTPAMREAMMAAALGDDVLGDDPTVKALEARCAALFGKDAALLTPSGTMANQLAIRAQTQPGDMALCHPGGHVYHYEAGAPAAVSGVTLRFVDGPGGVFTPDALEAALWPEDHHFAPAALVIVENTNNTGGGRVWPLERVAAVSGWARARGLRVHMDGARIWNAHVASGTPLERYAELADTVSACFSKGLGAPVGSILVGDAGTIARAHRLRKMLGGSMRQAGLLAAAALHALDHHVGRLAEDHAHARRLAEGLAGLEGVELDPSSIETNIVYFGLAEGGPSATEVVAAAEARGVRVLDTGPRRIRAVTHLGVDDAGIDRAIEAFGGALVPG
jgi:threonine aldolase